MGDGQFVGGGSVDWTITHTDGDRGNGNQGGGNGRDRDPKNPNAKFRVFLNDVLQFEADVRGNRIKVEWGR